MLIDDWLIDWQMTAKWQSRHIWLCDNWRISRSRPSRLLTSPYDAPFHRLTGYASQAPRTTGAGSSIQTWSWSAPNVACNTVWRRRWGSSGAVWLTIGVGAGWQSVAPHARSCSGNTVDARQEELACPFPGYGDAKVTPPENFLKYNARLCNLMHFGGEMSKMYNLMFNSDFERWIWWHQVIKSCTENRRICVPAVKIPRLTVCLPRTGS